MRKHYRITGNKQLPGTISVALKLIFLLLDKVN